ncbi:MAG: hypothetical protein AB8B86_05425 [Pseudomonadales bacterium]
MRFLRLCSIVLLVAVQAQAQATENRVFKIKMGPGWAEMKAGQDDDKYYYSYGNRDDRAFVLFHVGKSKDKKYTEQLSDELIGEATKEVTARGGAIQESARYKRKGCTVDYLAYFKPEREGTNVDFYMYCSGKLITANYALQGMDVVNIARAKDIHKSFKLK